MSCGRKYEAAFDPVAGDPVVHAADDPLAAVGLGFLFYVGGQSALSATRDRMAEMAVNARSEIGLDSGGFAIDSDLEYFRDGIYL